MTLKLPRPPEMVMLEVSVKVDRVANQRISWGGNYANPESEEFQVLEWEAKKAVSTPEGVERVPKAYMERVPKAYIFVEPLAISMYDRATDMQCSHTTGTLSVLQH